MSKYLLLLIFICSVYSQTNNVTKTTPTSEPSFIDELSYVKYRSQISPQARSEYKSWIGYKNSFSLKKNNFTRMYLTFSPESQEYYPRLYSFGWVFYGLATLCLLVILVYIIGRIFCKRFRGPKNIGDYYRTATYWLIGTNKFYFRIEFRCGIIVFRASYVENIIYTVIDFLI